MTNDNTLKSRPHKVGEAYKHAAASDAVLAGGYDVRQNVDCTARHGADRLETALIDDQIL